MFNKLTEIKNSVKTVAVDTAGGVSKTLQQGVDTLSDAATTFSDTVNDKAVKVATSQMCTILELAIEEISRRPISSRSLSLTSTVNIGIASLEMQIHLSPEDFK
jgi:hypothetical protein